MSDSLQSHELQHTRAPCPSPTPRVYPNPCPFSRWCHPTISSSVVPFSCPQSFPTSGSFQMSQLFTSGGQSIGVSASTSVLPMNTQDWFPLGWTGWISLQSKGLSRVFSNTTVQKHQFFWAGLILLISRTVSDTYRPSELFRINECSEPPPNPKLPSWGPSAVEASCTGLSLQCSQWGGQARSCQEHSWHKLHPFQSWLLECSMN